MRPRIERAAGRRAPIQILTEEEFCRLAGVPTAGALKRQYHAMRDLLARYRALREDHLRYLVKCGVLRPVLRTNADTFFAFPDVAAIKQANDELAQGGSFRSVVRTLIAMRQGQLEFDFRLDATPAQIISLRRHRTEQQPPSPQMPERHDVAPRQRAGGGLSSARHPRSTMATSRSAEEAAAAYRKALELDPYLVAALINLANIHYSRDELAEAAGAVRARDRARVRLLRGALQPRQHLSRPRPLHRSRRPAIARRCASIPSTPTRTSTWR